MILDEAIDVAKTVCAGDQSAALFALLPLHHGSSDKTVVLKNRRLLEDKILKFLARSFIFGKCVNSF